MKVGGLYGSSVNTLPLNALQLILGSLVLWPIFAFAQTHSPEPSPSPSKPLLDNELIDPDLITPPGADNGHRELEDPFINPGAADQNKSNQTPALSQKLQIAENGGLLSILHIELSPREYLRVRALMEIDGHLVALPPAAVDSRGFVDIAFPTPVKSLSYRLQVTHFDKTTTLDGPFTMQGFCVEDQLVRAISTASDFPDHGPLTRKAVEVEREHQRLEALLEELQKMGQIFTPQNTSPEGVE